LDDIERTRRYLNRESSGLGERFLDELNAAMERLVEQPDSFPLLETLDVELPIRRIMLTTFSHVIAFEIIDEEVVVLAISHHSRSNETWIRRRP